MVHLLVLIRGALIVSHICDDSSQHKTAGFNQMAFDVRAWGLYYRSTRAPHLSKLLSVITKIVNCLMAEGIVSETLKKAVGTPLLKPCKTLRTEM